VDLVDKVCKYWPYLGSERDESTHCARRPSCVIVTMILSLNEMDVTSVTIPLISPTACFVCAGYGKLISPRMSAIP
jgi:hypothetical protein